MNDLPRIWLILLVCLLGLPGRIAFAADDDGAWAPTPPRLSFIDGEVSYWRSGADGWARAQPNLALAEGDALYTGNAANLEVQFGSRSFVRADENSQLSLMALEEHRIQFKLTGGLVSFDLRRMTAGDTLEVSTPNAVFTIAHPGYYRVEASRDSTHFITRRGGEATVTAADGRSLGIYPSEEAVVTAGNPVDVATYAAPAPDGWDRWNDERSDRIGESISARYLPPEVYGAEELDHYGQWRVVPAYGSIWIPYGMSADWVPYSTGYWVWDPYYEWTWIDDAPWGWAPFHYGRWVYIDGYWAWAPGPVVRQPVYSPALVGFMIRNHDVSMHLGVGLTGLWWVALGWGEPVLPWWGPPSHRGHPHWRGWGGPRIVNNRVIHQATVIHAGDIHFHNASLPQAIRTAPADKFGRERARATVEKRYRPTDFVPVRGELPVKPTRASLFGGAPGGEAPPRDILARPVVTTRLPRERAEPWKGEAPRIPASPAPRYVIPPAHRVEAKQPLPRPPFGTEAGPERTPPPLPPRYGGERKPAPPPLVPGSLPTAREQATPQATTREQASRHREAGSPMPPQPAVTAPPPAGPPISRPTAPDKQTPHRRPETAPSPAGPARPSVGEPPSRPTAPGTQTPRMRIETAPPPAGPAGPAVAKPPRSEDRQERRERPLPGHPANQTYKGRDHDDKRDAH